MEFNFYCDFRMGTGSAEKTNVLSGLEEIDFIDVSSIQHDDDVLVNLDAFDMLSEFPELDTLDHHHNTNPSIQTFFYLKL